MTPVKLVGVLGLMVLTFQGCVRLAGGAGYWHTNAAGETQSKQAGFDTNRLVPDGQSQGSIQ